VQHTRKWGTRRSGVLVMAGLVSFGLIAAACGSSSKSSSGTTTTAAGSNTTAAGGSNTSATTAATTAPPVPTTTAKPVPGGKVTVRVEAEVAQGWTPANMQCDSPCQMRARTFFEPFVASDTNGKIQPFLAQSIAHSADYKTWTVKLRPNIPFSDGTILNADVAVDNINRARKSFLVGAALTNIANVRKVDNLTVAMDMKVPWPDFPYYMTGQGFFMASSKWLAAVDKDPTQATKPVGTGPFIMTSYTPGQGSVVKKNPNYWRKNEGLPYLDEIDFRVITDSLTAANAMKSGQLDIMSDDNGQNVKTFKNNKDFNFLAQSQWGETFYVLLNVGQAGSPLADQNVRCGLTAATDSKTLIDATQAGQLQVANGPFSPGQQGYLASNGAQTYDPAKAKQLIKTWSDAHGGQKPKIIYTSIPDATALQVAQLLQQWWNDAGADVQILQLEQSKLITNALLGDPQFMAFNWRNHAGLVFDNQYFWWNSVNAQPPGQLALNFGRLHDPVIDQLQNDARSNADPAKVTADAEAANKEFAKQCWIIPWAWVIWGITSKPTVQGIGTTTFPAGAPGTVRDGAGFPGQIWFDNVWLKQ
jgi:ABC-type transport system substrate-binding protein